MSTTRRTACLVALHATVIAVIALATTASAEPPREEPSVDRATLAEALFERGKALMADHRFDEACPKLAESQRLDPAGGTLLTLALCHERQGKTATAWTELKDALTRAETDGATDRATVAKRHAEALEPRLSRLSLRVDPSLSAVEGLTITRDGIVIGRPAWDLSVPVDPGDHDIEVTAPGKRAWKTRVTVGSTADIASVNVPPLVDLGIVSPSTPANVDAVPAGIAPSRVTPRTAAAISLGAVGAVALGLGTGFGVRALVLQANANKACPTTMCTNANAIQSNSSARSSAWVADVALPLGVAAGIAGIVVFATRPKAPTNGASSTSRAFSIGISPTGSAWAQGSFQ